MPLIQDHSQAQGDSEGEVGPEIHVSKRPGVFVFTPKVSPSARPFQPMPKPKPTGHAQSGRIELEVIE